MLAPTSRLRCSSCGFARAGRAPLNRPDVLHETQTLLEILAHCVGLPSVRSGCRPTAGARPRVNAVLILYSQQSLDLRSTFWPETDCGGAAATGEPIHTECRVPDERISRSTRPLRIPTLVWPSARCNPRMTGITCCAKKTGATNQVRSFRQCDTTAGRTSMQSQFDCRR